MFRQLWGRITGADKKKAFPDQQGSTLGRLGDFVIVFPYGMHADLPDDALFKLIAPGVAVPVTEQRPSDAARGEPVIFHPSTNSRVIFRNNGNIDITASNVNITAELTTINGDLTVTGNTALDEVVTSDGTDISNTHTHPQGNDSDGDTEVDTGAPV